MKQGSSGLTIREFQVYHKPAFELTPRKVSQWAKSLPMANLGDSSKNIYRMMVDVNQSLLDPDKRLAIVNTLELIASDLVLALEKQFLSKSIALTDKQRKIAALVQAIQTELCIGYHTVIESIISQDVKRSHKKLLATALAMATRYHGLVIFRCYQLYASIPKRLWRELYCLYQIAQAHQIDEQKVLVESAKTQMTIRACFTRILLLSVANPYQLRQEEVKVLWKLLPEIVPHVSLMSHAFNKQHYVIPINSFLPPHHKSLHKPQSKENNLKLTVFTAIDYLKQMLAAIKDDDRQNARKTMLIRHLIQSWSHSTHRAFARTQCDGKADISFGIGATHYLLSRNEEDEPEQSESNNTLDAMEGSLKNATLTEIAKRKRKGTKLDYDYLSSSGPPDANVWAKLYRTDKEIEEQAAFYQTETRSRETIVRDSYKSQIVELLNMSPNGFCIQLTSNELPKNAQTGEILGFLEADAEQQKHLNIAVVRWVRRQPKGSIVQMGIQLLSPSATPVNVQLRNSRSEKNEFQRALKLPALTGVGQPQTLLTNSLSFTTNRKVKIVEDGNEYDARLSKEITATGSFRQFSYEILGGRSGLSSSASGDSPSLDPKELDGVWDLI